MNLKANKRAYKIILSLIDELKLNLSQLTIFTEAASGAYLYTPLIGALADAKEVICYTRDSSFSPASEVIDNTMMIAKSWGIAEKINIVTEKKICDFSRADIITNSGFVRPITEEIIKNLRNTAVIPLMWETWEFRESDLDLKSCNREGILVLGTNEHQPPCNMSPYSGFMGMKLLFEMGIEGYRSKIILLGAQPTLGEAIYKHLQSIGCEVAWFGDTEQARNYSELSTFVNKNGDCYDAIICAEHAHSDLLIGDGGYLSFSQLEQNCENVGIGVIAGNIDRDEIEKSSLNFYPKNIKPFGFMSYTPDSLGMRPVLDLYSAGLKVGEVMAKARLNGMNVQDAARHTLENSPAMDFTGNLSWLTKK